MNIEEIIQSLKKQIEKETGETGIKIQISEEILEQIKKEENDTDYLNYSGETKDEKRYNESVTKSCQEIPIILKEVIIENGNYQINVKAYISKHSNKNTGMAYLYYYYRLYEIKNKDNSIENWNIVSDNIITRSLLETLGKTDEELNIKYTDSYTYRTRICDSIDLFWD